MCINIQGSSFTYLNDGLKNTVLANTVDRQMVQCICLSEEYCLGKSTFHPKFESSFISKGNILSS